MEVARNETPGGLSVPQRWVSGKLSLGDSAALASVLAVPPARWPPEPLALHLQNSGRGWEGVCVSSPGRFAGEKREPARSTEHAGHRGDAQETEACTARGRASTARHLVTIRRLRAGVRVRLPERAGRRGVAGGRARGPRPWLPAACGGPWRLGTLSLWPQAPSTLTGRQRALNCLMFLND